MDKEFIKLSLQKARALIAQGERGEAKAILMPLGEVNNPEALFLLSSYLGYVDDDGVFHEDPEWVNYLKRAADLEHPEALYNLGVQYDVGGDFPVDARDRFPLDKKKAAQLFKRAAEIDHPHSIWIHGEDLLCGRNGIEKNEKKGLEYIIKAAELKFEGAVLTMIEFYETGAFGFPKDLQKAEIWRSKLNDDDLISY